MWVFILRVLGMASAFMALIWFAGAADMTGLASYVVIMWWSIGGLFAVFAVVCFILVMWMKSPGRDNAKESSWRQQE